MFVLSLCVRTHARTHARLKIKSEKGFFSCFVCESVKNNKILIILTLVPIFWCLSCPRRNFLCCVCRTMFCMVCGFVTRCFVKSGTISPKCMCQVPPHFLFPFQLCVCDTSKWMIHKFQHFLPNYLVLYSSFKSISMEWLYAEQLWFGFELLSMFLSYFDCLQV